jgi:hypothetical protein
LVVVELKSSTRARPRCSSPERVSSRRVVSRGVTWMLRGVKESVSVVLSVVERAGVADLHWSRACLMRARELTEFPAMAWERAMARDLCGELVVCLWEVRV